MTYSLDVDPDHTSVSKLNFPGLSLVHVQGHKGRFPGRSGGEFGIFRLPLQAVPDNLEEIGVKEVFLTVSGLEIEDPSFSGRFVSS